MPEIFKTDVLTRFLKFSGIQTLLKVQIKI